MFRVVIAILVLIVAACGSADVSPTTVSPGVSITTTTAVAATIAPTITASPSEPPTTIAAGPAADCAHVVDVTIEQNGDAFTVATTVASGDTGWDKYADAWQVWDPDGAVLGERILTHPHETEQPFTRSLSNVVIPDDVDAVTVAARDLVLGFCGDTLTVEVPRS